VKIYYIDVRKHKTTVTNRWFIVNQMSGYSVSSTNKTYCHDIAEILLKVSLNTITLTLTL